MADPTDLKRLYQIVQLLRLYGDSKTFPDAIAKVDMAVLLKIQEDVAMIFDSHFQEEARFTEAHFTETLLTLTREIRDLVSPAFEPPARKGAARRSIDEHIQAMWTELIRHTSEYESSTVLQMKHPYIVPGGRYSEMYYWDSYFICCGLLAAGKVDLMRGIINNCLELVNKHGYVPNGNRDYYLGRSQPPLLSFMLELIPEGKTHGPVLEKEYNHWMEQRLHAESGLNHYSDEHDTPRLEGYWEDQETAMRAVRHGREKEEIVYRDLRAAAESGFDFSSRWLKDATAGLWTICTTEILPVDLNSLLYHQEVKLASFFMECGDWNRSRRYAAAAVRRKEAILRFFWDKHSGWFRDYNYALGRQTDVLSLAGIYPLFAGLLDPVEDREIVVSVVKTLEKKFLCPGGVVTTLTKDSKEQWDWPNGWPPLELITVFGLDRYEFYSLAQTISTRFRQQVRKVYDATGRIMEKYDVVNMERAAGGGEYPNQDGFGWTNAAYLALARFETT